MRTESEISDPSTTDIEKRSDSILFVIFMNTFK